MRGTEPPADRGPWDSDRQALDDALQGGSAARDAETNRRRRARMGLWLMMAFQLATTVALGVFIFKATLGR